MTPFAVLSLLAGSALAQQLTLQTNYSGSAFFDLWEYKVGNDAFNFWGDPANEGTVNFTDKAFAQQQGLLSINSAGNVIVKVDNFTTGANDPTVFARNSVQLLSKTQITPGSLVIMDAVHMPFGCAVWPAFWLTGGANWPTLGEIDIVENVNLATTNAYSLHTTDGCMASSDVQFTGNLVTQDCFNATMFDEGCKVVDSTQSYGSGFAANGGGAFAVLWNDDGIKIWFFPRPSVPADIASATPNPAGWGTPTAFYPSSTCDTTKFFGPQTMILEIDVCGNFAVDAWNQTCSAVAAGCTDVIGNPQVFNDAYFEIQFISVFSNSTVPVNDLPVLSAVPETVSGTATFSATTVTPTPGSVSTSVSAGSPGTTAGSTSGGSSSGGSSSGGSSTSPSPSPVAHSAALHLHSLSPLPILAGLIALAFSLSTL